MTFFVASPDRMVSDFMDGFTQDFTQDLMQVQATLQACRSHLVHLQTTIGIPDGQRTEATIQAWKKMQTVTVEQVIPELNRLLETIEAQNLNPTMEKQLRSLNPEVTRLIKLLQIDWQFWQAARQVHRIGQRQGQLLKHLQQLDQLLEAIGHQA